MGKWVFAEKQMAGSPGEGVSVPSRRELIVY